MQDKIMRKFLLGFIQIHILHHAKKMPFYGVWMIEELHDHGYDMSPGTLYPLLHNMETSGFLKMEEKIIDGKIRKYYSITELGITALEEAQRKANELLNEIKDE